MSFWRLLLPCLLVLAAGSVQAKNPVVSQWMKNLSYTSLLEPSGTVWGDELGDLGVAGKNVHTLWHGRKDDSTDERFVYRRSVDEGATWKAPVVIASASEYPGSSLVRDGRAKYLCVTGSTVHVVVARSFPVSASRSWHYNLYYYRSTNNGATFEPARLVASGADVWHIRLPRVACNAQRVVIGYQYVANWYNNYQIPLLISDDGGLSFSNAVAAGSGEHSGIFEDLALSGTDIYVLHYRLLEPYYYGNFQARIGLSSSSDDGQGFTERWLTTNATDGRYYALSTKDLYNSPDLAVVGSRVSVIWTQLDTDYNGTKNLMLAQSLDKGKTFGAARVLYRGGELAPGQATIAAKGEHLYVLFPTTDGKVRLRRSTDRGATLKATQIVSNEGGWWPEVQIAPDDATGATVYLFWDHPSYRRSTSGGGAFEKVLWTHPAFTTGNYQRSRRVVTAGQKIHTLTSAQLYSSALCGGYCDRDMLYRRVFPAPGPGAAGGGLRLFTESVSFEDRADNVQVLSKTLDITGALTAEVWVKDMGGGITTGYSDAYTPILFKQRDLGLAFRPAFGLGTVDSYGSRRIVADIETTSGSHRVTGAGDAGLLSPKTWTHLAMVYQPSAAASNLQLFKNGKLIGSETVSGDIVPGFGNLFVGRYGNWVVDELRVWGVAVGQADLKARSAAPLAGTPAGLRAYFNFDQTTGDVSGKGNDGILMYKEEYVAGRY
jgi:hypothetical protein